MSVSADVACKERGRGSGRDERGGAGDRCRRGLVLIKFLWPELRYHTIHLRPFGKKYKGTTAEDLDRLRKYLNRLEAVSLHQFVLDL